MRNGTGKAFSLAFAGPATEKNMEFLMISLGFGGSRNMIVGQTPGTATLRKT